MRYDRVYFEEFDAEFHYIDGKYVGHDDQFDIMLEVPEGGQRDVLIRNWATKDDVDFEAVQQAAYGALTDMEPFLLPMRA